MRREEGEDLRGGDVPQDVRAPGPHLTLRALCDVGVVRGPDDPPALRPWRVREVLFVHLSEPPRRALLARPLGLAAFGPESLVDAEDLVEDGERAVPPEVLGGD